MSSYRVRPASRPVYAAFSGRTEDHQWRLLAVRMNRPDSKGLGAGFIYEIGSHPDADFVRLHWRCEKCLSVVSTQYDQGDVEPEEMAGMHTPGMGHMHADAVDLDCAVVVINEVHEV